MLTSHLYQCGFYNEAKEWLGFHRPNRAVAVVVNDKKKALEIRTHSGELLRSIDFSGKTEVDVVLVGNGKHFIVKNPIEYDCVLEFGSSFLRESFYTTFTQR